MTLRPLNLIDAKHHALWKFATLFDVLHLNRKNHEPKAYLSVFADCDDNEGKLMKGILCQLGLQMVLHKGLSVLRICEAVSGQTPSTNRCE